MDALLAGADLRADRQTCLLTFGERVGNGLPAELRRRAIYNNYRGIVDPLPGGGMGLLWGPQSPGTPSFPGVPFGLIPGVEYKAYLRVPDGHGHVNNVPAAVQIPRHFNEAKPCIVAAMPSGSRSLYGGIAVAEWALFKGCAVALPGKGTDTGFHLLTPNLADDLDGVYQSADALGQGAQFAVAPSKTLDAYVEVRDRQPIPVAGGETWHGRAGFAQAIEKRAVAILQPDVAEVHVAGGAVLGAIHQLVGAMDEILRQLMREAGVAGEAADAVTASPTAAASASTSAMSPSCCCSALAARMPAPSIPAAAR